MPLIRVDAENSTRVAPAGSAASAHPARSMRATMLLPSGVSSASDASRLASARAGGNVPASTTSEMEKRPPGFSTRWISAKAAYRVGAVLETVFRLFRVRSEPPLTRFVAKQLATAHWYRTENIERDLGYRPAVSMEQGMERLAAAWAER